MRVPQRKLSGQQWHGVRWLILAPHPDDETLGAGALFAQAERAGCLAGVAYLTDGTGSHRQQRGPWGGLRNVREREARAAVRRLTACNTAERHPPGYMQPPIFLGWKDAAPAGPGDPLFDGACRRLASLCRHRKVDAIAVTALHEPHCDHAAAAQLAYAVQKATKRRLTVAEYIVWADAPPGRSYRAIATAPMLPGVRRHALRAHRSQLTASHGEGFRLPKYRQRMSARDVLYLQRQS